MAPADPPREPAAITLADLLALVAGVALVLAADQDPSWLNPDKYGMPGRDGSPGSWSSHFPRDDLLVADPGHPRAPVPVWRPGPPGRVPGRLLSACRSWRRGWRSS